MRGAAALQGIVAGVAVWLCAGPAVAQAPSISVTESFAGAGLVGFEVAIELDDALNSSVFVAVVFSGPFVQLQSSGLDIDLEADAASLDGVMGYDMDLDSYFRTDGYADLIELQGGAPGSTEYFAMLGSGAGSMLSGSLPLAYLVLPDGEAFSIDALVSRGGVDFELTPEPSAGLLLLSGSAFLLVLGRWRVRR